MFIHYILRESPSKVYLGDNSSQDIEGHGDVHITLPQGGTYTIQNILHIPTLCSNLISVSRVTDSGLQINFSSKDCSIKDPLKHKAIATSHRLGNLYQLNLSNPTHPTHYNFNSTQSEQTTSSITI